MNPATDLTAPIRPSGPPLSLSSAEFTSRSGPFAILFFAPSFRPSYSLLASSLSILFLGSASLPRKPSIGPSIFWPVRPLKNWLFPRKRFAAFRMSLPLQSFSVPSIRNAAPVASSISFGALPSLSFCRYSSAASLASATLR